MQASHTERQFTLLMQTTEPILDPRWIVANIGLEDLVLAYMARPSADHRAPTFTPAGIGHAQLSPSMTFAVGGHSTTGEAARLQQTVKVMLNPIAEHTRVDPL